VRRGESDAVVAAKMVSARPIRPAARRPRILDLPLSQPVNVRSMYV
jgi:hypothetical protein